MNPFGVASPSQELKFSTCNPNYFGILSNRDIQVFKFDQMNNL